jgi:sRNA-binding carbon storage regulator CsrA
MLCLTVREDDGGVWIGNRVKVHVIERLSDGKLRLAIEAPESLEIDRHVIREQKQAQLLPREPGALERSLRQQA